MLHNLSIPLRLGLLGWPVQHSLSPVLQQIAFDFYGMSASRYELLPVAPEQLAERFSQLREEGFHGLNVTVPHKQSVIPWLQLTVEAEMIGAVNTICLRRGLGTNTDATGFLDDLHDHGVAIEGKRALILGAGGSARAVAWALNWYKAELGILARRPEAAQFLQEDMQIPMTTLNWDNVFDWEPELIVHCTPVGMWPSVEGCVWPQELPFPKGAVLYDLVYRPARTALMERAEAAGSRAIGGLGMLAHQGARAFEFWTGRKAPASDMKQAVQAALEAM